MESPRNMCLVGVQGSFIRVMHPGVAKMDQETALNLAAWIVTLIPDGKDRFDSIFDAITTSNKE